MTYVLFRVTTRELESLDIDPADTQAEAAEHAYDWLRGGGASTNEAARCQEELRLAPIGTDVETDDYALRIEVER